MGVSDLDLSTTTLRLLDIWKVPVGIRLWQKRGPSKVELALSLLHQARHRELQPTYVLCDSWYAAAQVLNLLEGWGGGMERGSRVTARSRMQLCAPLGPTTMGMHGEKSEEWPIRYWWSKTAVATGTRTSCGSLLMKSKRITPTDSKSERPFGC